MTIKQQRARRKHRVGLELRGAGPRALIAATVLQAIADLERDEELAAEAWSWLRSADCRYCLEILEIPYRDFLDVLPGRRLCRGTSTRAFWEDVQPRHGRVA